MIWCRTCLRDLGVEQVFHGVRLKPGKPIWFGVLPHAKGPRLVFGLPGNPVSGLVCFELFVRPAIAALAGARRRPRPHVSAQLTEGSEHRGDRPTYFPVQLEHQAIRRSHVARLAGLGRPAHADCADGLALFPAGRCEYDPGETVTVMLL
jgi:molybdopterin molybdotransferase